MINPFISHKERRLRAFFRLVLFFTCYVLLISVSYLVPYTWLAYVTGAVLITGLYYLMLKYVDFRPWHESGLIPTKTWINECSAGVGIAAAVMALIFLVEWLSGTITITGFGWQRNGEVYWLLLIVSYFIQMAAVGLNEEIMARGYILRNLAEGFSFGKISPVQGTIMAVIFSSAIFGVLHAGNPNATVFAVLNIILAGVMLAIPFVITGRLALSVGLHIGWNFFQGGVFGFPVSGMLVRTSVIQIKQTGPNWWTGGTFGPEGGLIGILGILLILICSVYYLKRTGVDLQIATTFTETFSSKKEN